MKSRNQLSLHVSNSEVSGLVIHFGSCPAIGIIKALGLAGIPCEVSVRREEIRREPTTL